MSYKALIDDAHPSLLESESTWRCVNDPVMGGQSISTMTQERDTLCFSGTVSLANNGGFASTRTECPVDLSDATGLALVAHGPPRRYRLTLFTESGGRISYRAPFWTTPHPATHYIPFARLRPMRRGRPRPEAPSFKASEIEGLGFLIGDKQAGDFALHVQRIVAYADGLLGPLSHRSSQE